MKKSDNVHKTPNEDSVKSPDTSVSSKTKKSFIFKIIKNNNDSWFSFLSGIFSNIPITLILLFEKEIQPWYYWFVFAFCIVFSIAIVVIAIRITIITLNIKEETRNKYDYYVSQVNHLVPGKLNFFIEEECRNKSAKFIKLFWALAICFVLLLVLIVLLWLINYKII